jgi:2-oxo-3-hexenedioate decarboxylase
MTVATLVDLNTDDVARDVLAALDNRRQIAPVSRRFPNFDLHSAYAVTAAVRRLREDRGERVVGRKIGFTNRTIWSEYGVYAPIWSYVYDTTVLSLEQSEETCELARFLEPRIEPEIVFGLLRAPAPEMDERALLSCIDWIAHGFEIVQSVFPGWKFTPPDTIAAFGLHGCCLVGSPQRISDNDADEWFRALPSFGIALIRDDEVMDRGISANVLDGPLSALRHLVTVLADDPHNSRLEAGEIISTGTLTRALPINPGETWRTELTGLPLEGIRVALT